MSLLYGLHVSAEEAHVRCRCGGEGVVEVVDARACSHGWYCHVCGEKKRAALRRAELKGPR